jgi:molecular chaperone GrpE (heat shock protein)
VEEVQRGYMLNERLLRPAKVIVGKAERDVNPGGG